MQCIAKLDDIGSPSYIVTCSGTREHAFVVSVENKKFWKKSWLQGNADDDNDKIDQINSQLPDYPELTKCFTGKYGKKLSEYYLGSGIIGFEDQVILEMPDAIFLQRMSARTKTFDMVLFYGNKSLVFSVVDKSDLDIIRNWYPHKIYSCGTDPLPIKNMEEWLDNNNCATMYDDIYEQLFNKENSSASEYEPESEPESEDESCDESEEESEISEEEFEESDQDGDYEPEDELEEDLEPPSKKIKV